MPESKVISLEERAKDEQKPFLEQLLREGARKLLQAAIENEVIDYIQLHKDRLDENGQRLVVRNGHLPQRTILTGIGAVEVKQPRVQDRRPPDLKEKFSPAVLPPYLRRTKSLDEAIPWLYLKGISSSDFPEALQALFGPDAKGLSANTVTRRQRDAAVAGGAAIALPLRGRGVL